MEYINHRLVEMIISASRPGSPLQKRTLRYAIFSSLVLFAVSFANGAATETVQGYATVIDGDTLEIADQVVRLHGIDAPEMGQRCGRRGGGDVRCGVLAANALNELTSGDMVTCRGEERDDYGRLIGNCWTGALDLNEAMVRAGWALAFVRYSEEFVGEERQARQQRIGIFAFFYEPPWDFRARRWQLAGSIAPDPKCPIKGNISRSGERIYHAPWFRDYDRTRINPDQGERWFCSEGEARAAGWRAPRS